MLSNDQSSKLIFEKKMWELGVEKALLPAFFYVQEQGKGIEKENSQENRQKDCQEKQEKTITIAKAIEYLLMGFLVGSGYLLATFVYGLTLGKKLHDYYGYLKKEQ